MQYKIENNKRKLFTTDHFNKLILNLKVNKMSTKRYN